MVALAAPGAVPVDGADLGVVLVQVDGALGARGGVGAAARGDVGRVVGRDGDLADFGAGDLRVFVAVFVELAPAGGEWIVVAKVWGGGRRLPEGLGVLDADGAATEAVDDVDDNPLRVGHDDGWLVCLEL